MTDLPIYVHQHARERARERFPGFKAARIAEEVRAAFRAGRVSPSKPRGIAPPDDPECLYLWTEDGERVYAVKLDKINRDEKFVVTTTMRAEKGRKR